MSRAFAVIAIERPKYLDPNDVSGTEHSEDTFDGDYGRLLDKFYRTNAEGMASPTGLADFCATVAFTVAA